MENLKKKLAGGLLKVIREKVPLFKSGSYKVIASSGNRPAYQFEKSLYDENDRPYDDPIFPDDEFDDLAPLFFIETNKLKKCNVFEVKFEGSDVSFEESWDQSVHDDFNRNLPDAMKGKLIPWYMQESEYLKNHDQNRPVDSTSIAKKWSPIGVLMEEFELGYFNPLHIDYTPWAGDRYLQLWRTHWNTYCVCTQGLHDEDNKEQSLDLELYLETIEKPEPFDSSWQANVIYALGSLLPKVKDLQQRFETYKYISVQIEIEGAPEDWSLDEKDNVGVLLGVESEEFEKRDMKFDFIPLNCKLLRPAETKMIKKLNAQGRVKLVDFFKQKGNATISSLDRPSAVRDE